MLAETLQRKLRFTYRNWRGEVAECRIDAYSVRMVFAATEWRREPEGG